VAQGLLHFSKDGGFRPCFTEYDFSKRVNSRPASLNVTSVNMVASGHASLKYDFSKYGGFRT
jgi:hypothetical protein